jgi:threonine dehydratase
MLNTVKNLSSNEELEYHLSEIKKAQTNLKDVSKKTALIYSDVFSNESGNCVLLNLKICRLQGPLKFVGPTISFAA